MLTGSEEHLIDSIKQNQKYTRILQAVYAKYTSTGRFSGVLNFENLSEEEAMLLAPVSHSIYVDRAGKIPVKAFFSKVLLTGSLSGVTPEEFFKQYLGWSQLQTKKEATEKESDEWKQFTEALVEEYKGTPGGSWLEAVFREKKHGHLVIRREYDNGKEKLREMLVYVIAAINALPMWKGGSAVLSIFSTEITSDPHYFDLKNTPSSLLIHGMCFVLGEEYPRGVKQTNEIFYNAGILRDTISSSTSIFNMIFHRQDGQTHKGIEGFQVYRDFINVPLQGVLDADRISTPCGQAFIFENPAVFTAVWDKVKTTNVSLICTSGQLNLSSLILLDKLAAEKTVFYYAGDFDPEGLQIAEKLKRRYGDNLVLWRFSADDYRACISHVIITKRLSKLKSITEPELMEAAKAIASKKRAGYQEFLVNRYIQDIYNIAI